MSDSDSSSEDDGRNDFFDSIARPKKRVSPSSNSNDESDSEEEDEVNLIFSCKKTKLAERIRMARKYDSSDDDDEKNDNGKKNTGVANPQGGPKQYGAATNNSRLQIAIDDDSDDEILPLRAPLPFYNRSGNKNLDSSQKAINKARQARFELLNAQNYRAPDVHVTPREIKFLTPSTTGRSNARSRLATDHIVDITESPESPADLGSLLCLKLRTKEMLHGKPTGTVKEDTLQIRARQRLGKLMERYRQQKRLDMTDRVVFSFEGQRLDLTKKPLDFDMEDDDIIEVQAPAPRAARNSGTTKKRDEGKAIRVYLRDTKGQRELIAAKEKQLISKLAEKYKKKKGLSVHTDRIRFQLDGEVMNHGRTIQSFDIEDEDLIDVKY